MRTYTFPNLLLLAVLAAGLSPAAEMQVLPVESYDGASIQTAIQEPDGAGPHPAVLFIHGGVGDSGSRGVQNMLRGPVPTHFFERGFVVMATDYRRYHFGEDEIQDVLAAYRLLAKRPSVDPERIAVVGGSHGGYLTQMLVTRVTPAAAVAFAGLSDIEGMFHAAGLELRKQVSGWDDWREKLLHSGPGTAPPAAAGGGATVRIPGGNAAMSPGSAGYEVALELGWRFGDDREAYRAISPKANTEKVKGPVLYLVGGADRLRAAGKAWVDDLSSRGVEAWYSEHRDMPHGFYWGTREKPQQFYDALAVTTSFIEQHVREGGPITRKDTIYFEAGVPRYELPALLRTAAGATVQDAESWRKERRPEVLELFETQVYGRAPGAIKGTSYEVFDDQPDALGGKARRKQITVRFGKGKKAPSMDILVYLPANAKGPTPIFLGLNFSGNQTVHADPGIRLSNGWMREREGGGVVSHRATEASRGAAASRWPIEEILARGYGVATIYCGDLDPDFDDGFQNGVHPLGYRKGQTKPADDEWGTISAWAWGLSRALDYFETDDAVDHTRVAVMGHSRLGKTSLWAGARDERFAMVISNDSGCGGAALSRRRFGETVARINSSFPHWFAGNFKGYSGNEDELPVDQHMLLALVAPRPLYVASAEEDLWADPRGEFLSAKLAGQVYELFGEKGVGVESMPNPEKPVGDTVRYHIRHGKHDVTLYDWQQYLNFADRRLKR